MKISPIAASGAGKTAIAEEGRSAGADRVARAKAVLAGGSPEAAATEPTPTDPQAARAAASIKKIRFRTNATPGVREFNARVQEEVTEPTQTEPPKSDISDGDEQAQATSEATKPLSPQFAALARQQRALQVKEREIAAREAALGQAPVKTTDAEILNRLKSDPLSVLDEQGVTYDQLTEALLARSQTTDPNYVKIQAELKALKEGLDNQNKSQTDRDKAAETQVLAQLRKDADSAVAASGDTYELVREAGYQPKVVELIHRTFKEKGEIMDVTEALDLIEEELVQEGLRYARLNKIKTQLAPPTQLQAPSNPKQIRTLTNRDGSTVGLSRKERAILAFQGKLAP